MQWRLIAFEVAQGDVVHASFEGGGHVVEIVADARLWHRTMVLAGFHILGDGPNTLGSAALRAFARAAMDWLDVDELRIEGATRTSGAGPGHDSRPLVFRRT